jgi:hypothetical protein
MQAGQVRYTPNRLRPIPMWSPRGGEEHRGYFLVPADSAKIDEHSNRFHQYKQHIIDNVTKWMKWKTDQGLQAMGNPTVYQPVESPRENPDADPIDGADLRVYVSSMFRRVTPLYGSNDDLHAQHQDALRYGVDINDTLRPINAIEKPAASLIADEQRNALEMAEERRKALNLKRTVQTKTDKDGDLVADGATVEPN